MSVPKFIPILCFLGSTTFGQSYVVVPNSSTSTPGINGNIFLVTDLTISQQEMIGADQFGFSPKLISQIAFRALPGSGPVNATISTLTLTASTSPYFPNTDGGQSLITTTFATNTGPDGTLVYDGPASLQSPGCPGPATCPFDMVITFSTPFLYDPNQGTLLFDFLFRGFTGVSGSLDSVSFPFPNGGSVAQITTTIHHATTGTFNPGGYILQIGYTSPAIHFCFAAYPCYLGRTLLLRRVPTGNLLSVGGAITIIQDPQAPGYVMTTGSPLGGTGPTQYSQQGTLSLAAVGGQSVITGISASLTCGVTGAATFSMTLTTPGGPLVLNCPMLSSAGATATVTGQMSFGPVASYSTTITLAGTAPGPNDSLALSGYAFQSLIPSAASDCTYALNPGGQAFNPGGGGGTISVTTGATCGWTVFDLPNWVSSASGFSGLGNGSVSYSVRTNTGAWRTATLSVGDLPYIVEQAPATIPGLAFVGAMPHVAAQENWITSFTFGNKGPASAQMRLVTFGDASDPGGNGQLPLLFSFPQQTDSSGPLLASTFVRTLGGNASLVADTAGPQIPPVLIGSGNLTATGPVDGFAIFHQIVTTQEAVVPMETRSAPSYLLAFYNTNGLVLGVALVNVSAANAVIPVVIRDDTGVVISAPGANISLPGNAHTSFVLSDPVLGFPVTANIRGTIEFDTPAGGRISVLGLRFSPPNSALTTIPAMANVGTGGGSIAHLASGGDGWQTTFVLVNTGTSAAQGTLSFYNDVTGSPLSLPLAFPQGGAATVVPSVTQMLGAGATLVIASGGVAPQLLTGSAQLTTAGHISGFVIFRHNNQEAVVPLESRNAGGYIIAFDNTSGTATGLAVNAVSPGQVNIPVTVRDSTGATIATDTLTLNANGHTQFTLGVDKYPSALTIRGTIEFDTPAGAQIGALGIRIPNVPTHTYTTLPALAK